MMIYRAFILKTPFLVGALTASTVALLQAVDGANNVPEALIVATITGVCAGLVSWGMLKTKVDNNKEDLDNHKNAVAGQFERMTKTVDTIAEDVKDISKSVNELVGESRNRATGVMRTRFRDEG